MSSIQGLIQNREILIIIVLSFALIGFDRLLLHRRLILELKHQMKTKDVLYIDQPDFSIFTVGLILLGIGLGAVIEAVFNDFQGGIILTTTGLVLIFPRIKEYIGEKTR